MQPRRHKRKVPEVRLGGRDRAGFGDLSSAANRIEQSLCNRACFGAWGGGITYLGWDKELHLKVAIKEYLPDGLGTRAPSDKTVSVCTGLLNVFVLKCIKVSTTFYQLNSKTQILKTLILRHCSTMINSKLWRLN
jgi:hypothetical protein